MYESFGTVLAPGPLPTCEHGSKIIIIPSYHSGLDFVSHVARNVYGRYEEVLSFVLTKRVMFRAESKHNGDCGSEAR